MTHRWTNAVAALALAMATGAELAAQQPPAAGAKPVPAVGDVAPDFEIRGSTRYGLLRDGLKLSDFRGQTVVLAFFARSRTRG
jgi:peroxiredoxin Q/BCP